MNKKTRRQYKARVTDLKATIARRKTRIETTQRTLVKAEGELADLIIEIANLPADDRKQVIADTVGPRTLVFSGRNSPAFGS